MFLLPLNGGFESYLVSASSIPAIPGNAQCRRIILKPALTTVSLASEVLESILFTLDQVITRLTVLILNASSNSERSS